MGDNKLVTAAVWRYVVLIFVGFLFIAISWMIDPKREPAPAPKRMPERRTILNAEMIPVDGAPEGTYIIEYSNGNKEILYPDGNRGPLVEKPPDKEK